MEDITFETHDEDYPNKILFIFSTKPELETILPIMTNLRDNLRYELILLSDANEDVDNILNGKNNTKIIRIEEINKFEAKNFLKKNNISLVFTAHEGSFLSQFFLIMAKKGNIPSIYLPHGLLGTNVRNKKEMMKLILKNDINRIIFYFGLFIISGYLFEVLKIWIYKIITGKYYVPIYTKICVPGPSLKNKLVNGGMNEEKIVISGQPRFDDLLNSKNNFKRLNLTENQSSMRGGKILLATQPFVEDKIWGKKLREENIQSIFCAMKNLKEFTLIVKTHPRENPNEYKKLLKNINVNNIIIIDKEDINELIYNCDVLLTFFSTVALEAMILDKPVIIINFKDMFSSSFYIDSDAVLVAYDPEDLISKVNLIIDNKKTQKNLRSARKEFVYKEAFIQDGNASERVVDLIIKLIVTK